MICKCQNCNAALIFQPSLHMMKCTACGSCFSPEEIRQEAEIETSLFSVDDEEMEFNAYICTACGAKILVNGVEASTFCAHCGQPTVVFERVTKEKKPKYIIPFQIEKEQAIAAIRQRLQKGKFVPNEIKNFETEHVKGIYVPFWVFDMIYQDKQFIKGTVGTDSRKTKYFYRAARAKFHDITIDASGALSSESSQRLEPFDLTQKEPFDISYLLGFYADAFDEERCDAEKTAKFRAQCMYDHEVKYSIDASELSVLSSKPEIKITASDYMMLPVWFLTFRYQEDSYTILVNGQTGKVIGAVPVFKKKVISKIILLTALFTPLFGILFLGFIFLVYLSFGHIFVLHWLIPGVIGAIMGGIASVYLKKVSASIRLTKANSMNTFVKNRQEV